MKRRIAIEPALSNIKDYLTDEGYDVQSMSINGRTLSDLSGFDAVVVSGVNTNLFGMSDTDTKAVVINADGLTPPEVADRLDDI